jgi:hypothetical protein
MYSFCTPDILPRGEWYVKYCRPATCQAYCNFSHVHRHDTVFFFWALSLHTLRFVKPGTWLCFVALAASNFKCTFYWVLLLRDHHTHAAWPICKLSCAPLPGIMLRVLGRVYFCIHCVFWHWRIDNGHWWTWADSSHRCPVPWWWNFSQPNHNIFLR